tara:strand:- start:4147 stop:4314 length:168 start_codon:yes stop_codon:yes gene_type:complete
VNWLKKAASPKLIKITLAVMAIVVVVMIAIGEYLAAFVFACISMSVFYSFDRTDK